MEFLLVPLIGPFHLRSPSYNSVTVRDILEAWEPEAVATSALAAGTLADPAWQDTEEVALPLTVAPWANRQRLELEAVGEAPEVEDAQEALRRYLEPYPQAMRRMRELDAQLEPVKELLGKPLTLGTVTGRLVPALRSYQHELENEFDDGPATEWLRQRLTRTTKRTLDLPAERVALLAPVDHLPLLHDLLEEAGAEVAWPEDPPASPEARERAILDFAFRAEAPDPGRLISQLREIAGSEARYHEANLLLAGGHGFEALELLEKTSHGDFSEPYFLPGYLLARLGQLRDLADRREDAKRAYRGVLALDYAPAEAREAAESGLRQPFEP